MRTERMVVAAGMDGLPVLKEELESQGFPVTQDDLDRAIGQIAVERGWTKILEVLAPFECGPELVTEGAATRYRWQLCAWVSAEVAS